MKTCKCYSLQVELKYLLLVIVLLFWMNLILKGQIQKKNEIPELWVVSSPETHFFPENWFSPPVSFSANPLSKEEKARCENVFKKFLYKYPPLFVNFHLNHFGFFSWIKMNGMAIPYIFFDEWILVLNIGRFDGGTDEWIEYALHRCFAERLWEYYGSLELKGQFESCNPKEFRYLQKLLPEVRSGQNNFELDSRLHKAGFATLVSLTSFTDDFCGIAAQLFMGKAEFGEAVKQNPALKKKALLVVEHYRKMDDWMDVPWFTLRIPNIKPGRVDSILVWPPR